MGYSHDKRTIFSQSPFKSSVELSSEMVPARFCSIISWLSEEEKKKKIRKKKSGSSGRIIAIYIYI